MQLAGIDPAHLSSVVTQLTSIVTAYSTPSITFAELFNLYYEKQVKRNHRAPVNAEYFYKCHGKNLADVPVNQMTSALLQDWTDKIADTKGTSAAKRAIDMMSAILNWGMRRGHVSLVNNPCSNVDRRPYKSRSRFLKPEELSRLNRALKEEPMIWRDFVWLSLFTGARKENVLSMRWDAIDFELGQWHIEMSKNGEELFIALTKPALALLKRRKGTARGDSYFVFPGRGNKGHLTEVKRMWKRVCLRAELSDLHIHDLRRTLASYMAMQGASPYQIGKALGHKDPRSTAIYARLDLNSVKPELEKVHNRWTKRVGQQNFDSHKQQQKSEQSNHTEPAQREPTLDARTQVLVEARLIIAMQQGANTRKEFHRKLGKLEVKALELTRVLEEMVRKGLAVRYQDDNSKDPHCIRYRLKNHYRGEQRWLQNAQQEKQNNTDGKSTTV